MIKCYLQNLVARCEERGYTLDEVRACIVEQDGDRIVVDETHPAYPKHSRILPRNFYTSSTDAAQKKCYAGTELKKLLKKWLNITATETCSCNARAQVMNANGCDWCEQNIDTIVGWLREEAKKRKLPFIDAAGKILIKRAIINARREMDQIS